MAARSRRPCICCGRLTRRRGNHCERCDPARRSLRGLRSGRRYREAARAFVAAHVDEHGPLCPGLPELSHDAHEIDPRDLTVDHDPPPLRRRPADGSEQLADPLPGMEFAEGLQGLSPPGSRRDLNGSTDHRIRPPAAPCPRGGGRSLSLPASRETHRRRLFFSARFARHLSDHGRIQEWDIANARPLSPPRQVRRMFSASIS